MHQLMHLCGSFLIFSVLNRFKMRKLFAFILLLAAATACSDKASKVLVLYYSQTGATKTVAEEFGRQLGADVVAFDVTAPYDGDFNATIVRCKDEMATGNFPVLAPLKVDFNKYDVIFLGYPIWFGTYAPPVSALLNEKDFTGKTIVPFCTFGSGGLESSTSALATAIPDAVVKDGYGVRAARLAAVPEEVERFLVEKGWKEGVVEALPGYSTPVPVSEEDVKVFDAACSDYTFPLGTPVAVGKRSASYGTDYVFEVESTAPEGNVSKSRIYVTVRGDAAPEFTKVVR